MAASPDRSPRQRTITVRIDAEIARRAELSGLLTPKSLTAIVEHGLKRREEFGSILDRLHNLPPDQNPPMTMEEVQAEVDAVRAERRKQRASRS
jgi:hypothetical protein